MVFLNGKTREQFKAAVNSFYEKSCQRRVVLKEISNISGWNATKTSTAREKLQVEEGVKEVGVKVDIDKEHENNLYLVTAYVNDIQIYLRKLENNHEIRQWYLENPCLKESMRYVLVNWLFEVQRSYCLLQETLHLSISFLDRYLTKRGKSVTKNKLQLVGITAISLAVKFEELSVIPLSELAMLCDSAYKTQEIKDTEGEMLRSLDFNLSVPTCIVFLRRFSMAALGNTLQHSYAKYFIDLALLNSSTFCLKPSLISAAAVYLSVCVTKGEVSPDHWTATLKHYSRYKLDDIVPVVMCLARVVLSAYNNPSAVVERYSKKELNSVAKLSVQTPRKKVLLKAAKELNHIISEYGK